VLSENYKIKNIQTMKNRILFYLFTLIFVCFMACSQKQSIVDENFKLADEQMRNMLTSVSGSDKLPRSVFPDGTLDTIGVKDWTSGFFPGVLWYMYEYTNDNFWKSAAKENSQKLLPIQYYTEHHDVGFMMYCSYGNGYRLTGDEFYKEVLVNSAKSLSTRFREKAGIIQSWDFSRSWGGQPWHCPVIIDNMMNLELLFFASKVTGDSVYRNIAVSHADKTLANQIREDYSCFHVVNYDTITGDAIGKGTRQGFADNSAWARGQGWAIYGFTMVYRETHDSKYLEAARKMADFYINHPNLPKDYVAYWDFNVDQPGYVPLWDYTPGQYNETPRDVSAAAIVASGLLELSTYLDEDGKTYLVSAEKILNSLSSKYVNNDKNKHHFILNHSVGNYPGHSEVDVPLVYADYYYLEALLRYKKIKG